MSIDGLSALITAVGVAAAGVAQLVQVLRKKDGGDSSDGSGNGQSQDG